MKADLKRVMNFLIIATLIVIILMITANCFSLINEKFHTRTIFSVIADSIITIGTIDLLLFIPSTIFLGFFYSYKYSPINQQTNLVTEQNLEFARLK